MSDRVWWVIGCDEWQGVMSDRVWCVMGCDEWWDVGMSDVVSRGLDLVSWLGIVTHRKAFILNICTYTTHSYTTHKYTTPTPLHLHPHIHHYISTSTYTTTSPPTHAPLLHHTHLHHSYTTHTYKTTYPHTQISLFPAPPQVMCRCRSPQLWATSGSLFTPPDSSC